MPIPIRVSGSSIRRPLLQAAVVALASLVGGAQAQTAPQLLPYTAKLLAGGGKTAITYPGTCPVSGNTVLDKFGDGCLATEIQLTSAGAHAYYGEFAGYALADSTGAVFFVDGYNGLVRRIDPLTGVVTAIAGQAASSPASGATCGAYTSTDTYGDGCLSTAVKLDNPSTLAFDAAGNLYVADVGYANIRKIAATGGSVTNGGLITLVAGGSTYGYKVSNTSTTGPVIAATGSYLDEPFGLSFDAQGNLYVADEGDNAIMVINLTGADETLQGLAIPSGAIEKLMGYGSYSAKTLTADCPNFVSTSSRGGCYFGLWKDGSAGISSPNDGPYGMAVVPGTTAANAGYIYFANEFEDNIGQLSPSNIITTYAGIQGTVGVSPKRATAGSFAMGSPFGAAADSSGNVYFTDASSGVVWRVDQAGKSMFVVAGGGSTVCTAATDTYGDGCPATQAKFGSSAGSSGFAGTVPPAPGVFGVSVDAASNIYMGDTETNLIREVSSGTQFGVVGANQPTQTLEVHFATGDGPAASGAYSLNSGAPFSLGTANCTTNSDNTTDCLLPVTAMPTVLGAFSGTLTVKSTLGGTGNFVLSGTYAQNPVTRTLVTATPASSCSGTTTYSTATSIALQAALVANGPSAPTGTITFYANGTALTPTQNVTNVGTTAAPVYGATMTTTFATPGTYTITASYTGDSYFKPSTGSAPGTVTTSNPSFTTSLVPYQQNTVTAGQTGLYSINVAANVYTGTITFGCSGLPANSSCVFSPASITANGCTTTSTVAVSILTVSRTATSSFGFGGGGPWSAISMIAGAGLALLIGLRRRRLPLRLGQMCMAFALLLVAGGTLACGKGTSNAIAGTPAGNYSITVTSTGSAGGTTSTVALPLTVN